MRAEEKQVYREAYDYLRYWKRVLGLESWDIRLAILPSLSTEGSEAEVAVSWEEEAAEVRILAPEVRRSLPTILDPDLEHTIVHELLHILFWPFHPQEGAGLADGLFEQTINRLARALVYARWDKPPERKN